MPSSKIQSLIGHFTHFHLLDSNCHPAQLGSWWLNMHRTDGPFSMAPQQLPYRAFGNYLFTRPTEPCLNGGSGAVLHWCTWLCFPTSWPEFTWPVPRLYQNGISPWKEARNMTQPSDWMMLDAPNSPNAAGSQRKARRSWRSTAEIYYDVPLARYSALAVQIYLVKRWA